MRFSFVVSGALGYHIANLFESSASFSQFDHALQLLNQQGFSGVELNLGTTEPKKLSRILQTVHGRKLSLAAVGTGLLYVTKGYSFTNRNASKRKKALAAVKQLIVYVSNEHATLIIGLIRGRPTVTPRATELFRDALAECDESASANGVRLAVEPINRYETPLLNTATEVAELIHNEKLRSTGLLLDTFHMNIEEASIESTIQEYRDITVHFQIADSNRLAPGRGHLAVNEHLRLLDKVGYNGWVSGETLDRSDSARAVVDTANFLHRHSFLPPP